MPFSVQDIRSFKFGEGNPVALSKYGTNYLETCRTMKNCVVNVDGSVQVRSGFQNVGLLPDKVEVEDMEFLDFEDERFFIFLTSDKKIMWRKEKTVAGEWSGPLVFSTDFPVNHGLDKLHAQRGNIVKIKKIKERIFVFFEKSFPYRIEIEKRGGNQPVARPFFTKYGLDRDNVELTDIIRYFPCSYNKDYSKEWGNMKITDLDWVEDGTAGAGEEKTYTNTGTCKIQFSTTAIEGENLKKLIGHPIHFSIRNGGNDFKAVDSEDPESWPDGFLDIGKKTKPEIIEEIEEEPVTQDTFNSVNTYDNSIDLPANPPVSVDNAEFQRGYTFFHGLITKTKLYGILDSEPTKLKRFTYSGGSWSVTDVLDVSVNTVGIPGILGSPANNYQYIEKITDIADDSGGAFTLTVKIKYDPNRKWRSNLIALAKTDPYVLGRFTSRGVMERMYNFHPWNLGVRVKGRYFYYAEISKLYHLGRSSILRNFIILDPLSHVAIVNEGNYKWRTEPPNSNPTQRIRLGYNFQLGGNHGFYPIISGGNVTGYYAFAEGFLVRTDARGSLVRVGATPGTGTDDRPSYVFNYGYGNLDHIDDTTIYSIHDGKLNYTDIPDASLDANKIKTVGGKREAKQRTAIEEAEEADLEANSEDEKEQKLLATQVKQVFASLGFRFFTVYPYEYEEATKKLKCKLYAIGFKVQDIFKNTSLGGDVLEGGVDETNHFIVSDWYDDNPDYKSKEVVSANQGFPRDGGSAGGKDFFLTGNGKLSYSKVNKGNEFGVPIKSLFATGGWDYFIGETKYTEILSGDFPDEYRTEAIDEFFNRVDKGTEAVVFSLGDPFTYPIRTIEGERVKFFNFVISEIGAFAQAGAQSVGLTDKGVFYWGINSRQDGRTSSFVNIGKVSKFLASPRFTAIIEVLDRLYVTDRFGDLYVVVYNQANKNFVTVPCGTNIKCRNVRSGVPYTGNRVLCIDSKNKYLYCLNSGKNGEFEGASQWTVGNLQFDLVKRFDNEHYVLGRKDNARYLLKLVEEQEYDNIEGSKEFFEAEIEGAPFTTSNLHPMHNFRISRSVLEVFLFSRDLTNIAVGVGDNLEDVRVHDAQGYLPEIHRLPKRIASVPGRGVAFKLKSDERGCLCGASVYMSMEGDRS